MAAGDILYRAISGAGEDIGKAIGESIKQSQKQKADITRDMAILDRLSQIPDPTDPTGKKTLVDSKKMMALRQLKGAQLQAAAEGEISAIEFGQKIYKAGAPIRSIMDGPQIAEKDGMKFIFNPKTGGYTHLPSDKSTKVTKPSDYEKSLSKYGLEPDDMQNIDEDSLKLLDKEGEEVKGTVPTKAGPSQTGPPTPGQTPGPPPQVEDLTAQAHSISGKAGDKEFKMPMGDFRKLVNMSKSQQAAPTAQQIPVVKTAAEAWKLAPGTLFKTPDGRYLRVPQNKPNGNGG